MDATWKTLIEAVAQLLVLGFSGERVTELLKQLERRLLATIGVQDKWRIRGLGTAILALLIAAFCVWGLDASPLDIPQLEAFDESWMFALNALVIWGIETLFAKSQKKMQ